MSLSFVTQECPNIEIVSKPPSSFFPLQRFFIFVRKIPTRRTEGGSSVTRCLESFSIFAHFKHWKAVKKQNNVAKVGPKFCQTLNNPSATWRRLDNFANVVKFRKIWSHWGGERNRWRELSTGFILSWALVLSNPKAERLPKVCLAYLYLNSTILQIP